MTVNDFAVSIIRTVVPLLVGAAITQLLRLGVDVDTTAATTLATTTVTGVYYAAVRAAERRWKRVGWLLGYPLAPTYPTAA